MTDAQRFIDSARSHLEHIAADIEQHFDNVATQMKGLFTSDNPFTPQLLRRPPPPPPPTTYQVFTRWITKHKAITAACLAFALTGSVGSILLYQHSKVNKKRRAAKSLSGARTEVVVLAGAVSSPIATTLALDLERRGFIVYVVTNSTDDELFLRSFQRMDLLPLPLALTDAFAAQQQIFQFQKLLQTEHTAFEEAEPHKLVLKGVILVPDSAGVPVGSVEDIASEEWSDAVNSKVLNLVATTQLFLPMMKEHASKLMLLTPTVTSALLLPGHSIENTVNAALKAFLATLSSELSTGEVPITHFKLGDLDIPAISAKLRRDGVAPPRLRATPLRKLHDSVFDTLVAKRPPRTWYVGRGSLAYDVIGSIAPTSIVRWMMELGRRSELQKSASSQAGAIESSASWERIEKNGEDD